jgi:hypothetical protein
MENQVEDQPVLNHIQHLVEEEHHRMSKGHPADRNGSCKSRWNWISVGTSAPATPFATSVDPDDAQVARRRPVENYEHRDWSSASGR